MASSGMLSALIMAFYLVETSGLSKDQIYQKIRGVKVSPNKVHASVHKIEIVEEKKAEEGKEKLGDQNSIGLNDQEDNL